MNHRKLRIAWSVAWGIVAVLLIALWVRSYWRTDLVVGDNASGSHMAVLIHRGTVGVSAIPGLAAFCDVLQWTYSDNPIPNTVLSLRPSYGRSSVGVGMLVPFWLTSCVAVSLASIPWLPWWSTRFSLRTLLIATTLVALGLGLIVWFTT